MPKTTVEALVEGGNATPGPPIGPALGPFGVNIMQVINEVNKKTEVFEGMKVPVKILIDEKTKEYEIRVGTPPTSSLVKTELNLETAAHEPGTEIVGDITIEQLINVVKKKHDSLLGRDLKNKVKEILGTCVSMGVVCEGKPPKQVIEEINKGEYDDRLGGEQP